MLGYCGRDCEQCEAYSPAGDGHSHCTGCRSEGPACHIPGKDCPIRLCARKNRQAFCATCFGYPCSKLKEIFARHPYAEEQLNKLLGATPV